MTCCFTGHRPHYYPWGMNETDPRCLGLKRRLSEAVGEAVEAGYDSFIAGGAMGADMWAAEEILARRLEAAITLELAVPFKGYHSTFPMTEKARIARIAKQADTVTVVSPIGGTVAYHARNRYMCDRSSLLIAVCPPGDRGGSGYTVDYAAQRGLRIVYIE